MRRRPDVVKGLKWRKPKNPAGVSVWPDAGMLFTGETYKDEVKLRFAKGALQIGMNDSVSLASVMPLRVQPTRVTSSE